MLDDLGNEFPENFRKAASRNLVYRVGTVGNDDYVSYHLYLVILRIWDSGTVTESKVHALLTYVLERNVLKIFSNSRLEVVS